MKKHLPIALASALLFGSSIAQAEIVVIVNANAQIDSVSEDEISRIFTGKMKSISGMSQIVPVNQNDGSEIRENFFEKVINKSNNQYKAYWAKLVFTGKGVPPKEVGQDPDIKLAVASNANMIGYLDAKYLDDSVKVVYRTM